MWWVVGVLRAPKISRAPSLLAAQIRHLLEHHMKLLALGVVLFAGLSGCGSAATDDSNAGGASNAGAPSGGSGASNASAGNNLGGGASAGGNTGGSPSSAGASSAGANNTGNGGKGGTGASAGAASAGGGSAGAAGNGAAGAPPGASPVKGVAFNLNVNGSTCQDLKTLGLSWYYAWSGGNAPCPGIEFVPQIWGSWKTLSWVPTPAKAVSKGAKYLLAFNEPDGAAQANMTVDAAIALWPDFDQPGVLIGSPAVAGQDDWLPNFMTQVAAKKLRVDFIALHWYGWNAGSCNNVTALESKVKWAEQWQRPIWITEWSCRLQSAQVTQKFFADALVMLQKHPLVQRYAWFLSRSTGEFADATLLDANGAGTGVGSEYIAAPSMR